MDSLFSFFSALNYHYLRGQIVLVPIVLVYFLARERRVSLKLRSRLHQFIIYSSLCLPALLLLTGFVVSKISSNTIRMPILVIGGTMNQGLGDESIMPFYSAFGIIGIIGCLYFLINLVLQRSHEAKLLNGQVVCKKFRHVELIISSLVDSPFSTGIINHRIYLPSRFLKNRTDGQMVLRHEIAHIRKRHSVLSFLEMINRTLFWFNPLSHLLALDGSVIREFECDESVTRTFNNKDYGSVLVSEAERLVSMKRMAFVNKFNRYALRKRIVRITEGFMLKTSNFLKVVIIASLAATTGIFVVVGCSERNTPGTTQTILAKESSAFGARSPADIKKVVQDNIGDLKDLYNGRLKLIPDLKGRMNVRFVIEGDGSVSRSKVVKSTMNDGVLEQAVAEEIKAWKFGASTDRLVVNYPFMFSE